MIGKFLLTVKVWSDHLFKTRWAPFWKLVEQINVNLSKYFNISQWAVRECPHTQLSDAGPWFGALCSLLRCLFLEQMTLLLSMNLDVSGMESDLPWSGLVHRRTCQKHTIWLQVEDWLACHKFEEKEQELDILRWLGDLMDKDVMTSVVFHNVPYI